MAIKYRESFKAKVEPETPPPKPTMLAELNRFAVLSATKSKKRLMLTRKADKETFEVLAYDNWLSVVKLKSAGGMVLTAKVGPREDPLYDPFWRS